MVFRVSTVLVGVISRSALDHNYYMDFEVFGVNVFNDKTPLTTSGTTASHNHAAGWAARKLFSCAKEFGVRLKATF
jgi:hypothetical protein